MIDGIRNDCSLCGACVQTCPAGCISLCPDDSGDVHVTIDADRCLDCHQCEAHCHIRGDVPIKKTRKAYASAAADAGYRQTSASGGAFAALAESCLRKGGVVFGCAWEDSGWEATHIPIEDIKDLHLLQGSKYVHSSTGSTFSQVKDALQRGRLVLYAGRPCQIAGLYCFLGKTDDHLITVDLVCHGVPKAQLFQEYIDYYEKRHGCRVINWIFRTHSKGREGYFGQVVIEKRGRRKKRPLLWNCDSYYSAFMHAISYREACYTCRYAQRDRVGDITLGDFWGIEQVLPGTKAGNISLVLVNSELGETLVRECSPLTIKEVDVQLARAHNGQLNAPEKKSESSERFWRLYRQGGWEAVDEAFRAHTRKKRLIAYAVFYCPQKLKKFFHSVQGRLSGDF